MIGHRCVGSPVGTLVLVAGPSGLTEVRWSTTGPAVPDRPGVSTGTVIGDVPGDRTTAEVLDRAAEQLGEYFAGTRREFDLPLAPTGTPFQLAAWEILRRIPFGETISYRQQAAALGDPAKARAVGSANGRNPMPIIVPCHRVCASGGGLGGFSGGLELKRWLLDHERRVAAAR